MLLKVRWRHDRNTKRLAGAFEDHMHWITLAVSFEKVDLIPGWIRQAVDTDNSVALVDANLGSSGIW